MELADKIKSSFPQTVITNKGTNGNALEVTFTRWNAVVTVNQDEKAHRYSATYPSLIGNFRKDWSNGHETSSNMLIEGLFWVLKQVSKQGQVKPEIVD